MLNGSPNIGTGYYYTRKYSVLESPRKIVLETDGYETMYKDFRDFHVDFY